MNSWHRDVELHGHRFVIEASVGPLGRIFIGTVASVDRVGIGTVTAKLFDAFPATNFGSMEEAVEAIENTIDKVGAKRIGPPRRREG